MFKNIFSRAGACYARPAMPYRPEHARRTRDRIVLSAQALFNLRGFDEVSIAEIMAKAGLTHGAFYRHFDSKGQLYAEVVALSYDFDRAQAEGVIDAYLSRRHLANWERGCPLISVPSDVARSDPTVKTSFQNVFKAMVACFDRDLKRSGSRSRPLAIAALCVGAMSVARAVEDPALADELRHAARVCALELGGWSARAKGRQPAR